MCSMRIIKSSMWDIGGWTGRLSSSAPKSAQRWRRDNPLSHDALLEFRKTLRTSYGSAHPSKAYDLNGYTMVEVVDDVEAVRRAFGYDQINLFSTSYGTQVAYLYCVRYPNAVKRNLMVGASSRGRRFDSLWEPAIIDAMLREYNALWKADREASANSPDIIRTMHVSPGRASPITWNDIPYRSRTKSGLPRSSICMKPNPQLRYLTRL